MIPVAFEYTRAESVEDALGRLEQHGDEAKLLAGGHSLLPLMKLRLATPTALIDIGRLGELDYIRDEGAEIAIGALTRHRTLETSALLAQEVPLLPHAAHHVGDPQVRHRGTLGGTLAHGDPASDLPAAMLALAATVVVQGPGGRRRIPVGDFFVGFLETALSPDEMIVEVRVPRVPQSAWSFQKFNVRAQDWAIVGTAVVRGESTAVALVNMGPTPLRAGAVERAVDGGASPAEAGAHADEGTEPPSDLRASSDYRRHLARVLVTRALEGLS
jgi:carbon-monoxide dehydrogenase medium subunit